MFFRLFLNSSYTFGGAFRMRCYLSHVTVIGFMPPRNADFRATNFLCFLEAPACLSQFTLF